MTVAQNAIPLSVAGTGHGNADFLTRQSWTGRMDGATFVYYQMNYVNDGVQNSSLSSLARSYAGWPIAASLGSTATMTVSSSGALTGTYFTGCTYTGQATATAQANVYDIAITLAGASCNGLQGAISGMLFHDAANTRVFAVAGTNRSVASTSTRAFMFVGQ